MGRVSDAKQRLMDAVTELIWSGSNGSTTIDHICEKAGVKKGSFYYFFKSKSELAAAALEADWNKKKADMDAIFSPTVPPLERFERYFDCVYESLAARQKQCGSILGCPMLSIGSEVSTQDQVVRETVDRILDHKKKFFVSAIRDAHAQGLIKAPNAEAKASALFACYHGTLAQARIQNDLQMVRDFKQVAMDVLGARSSRVAAST